MAKFQGYYKGWDRCEECGQRLLKSGNTLRHKPNTMKLHKLVIAKQGRNI